MLNGNSHVDGGWALGWTSEAVPAVVRGPEERPVESQSQETGKRCIVFDPHVIFLNLVMWEFCGKREGKKRNCMPERLTQNTKIN